MANIKFEQMDGAQLSETLIPKTWGNRYKCNREIRF